MVTKAARHLSWMAAIMSAAVAGPATGRAQGAPGDCVGPPSNTWLTVAVNGVRSSSGLVAVTVYADDRSRFLVKRGSVGVMRVKAIEGETRACVFLPGPGTWALAIYHDENGNEQFDRSGLGLPREGYGFTNNPSTLAGLPNFGSVRLSVPKPGLLTRIRLKYP